MRAVIVRAPGGPEQLEVPFVMRGLYRQRARLPRVWRGGGALFGFAPVTRGR